MSEDSSVVFWPCFMNMELTAAVIHIHNKICRLWLNLTKGALVHHECSPKHFFPLVHHKDEVFTYLSMCALSFPYIFECQ